MCLCEDTTLRGAGKEINKTFNFSEMHVMKWYVVTDAIKPVTDVDIAILGCLIHLSGCQPGKTAAALVLLIA